MPTAQIAGPAGLPTIAAVPVSSSSVTLVAVYRFVDLPDAAALRERWQTMLQAL